MNEQKLMKSAYSYYWPEVRAVIDEVVQKYPHEVFMRSLNEGLDDFDKPIIEKFVNYRNESVPHLGEFTHRYSTAGAEEGIRETLTYLKNTGVDWIYVLKGDYEGYEAVAKTRGIDVKFVDEDEIENLEPGFWYISNPSGRDGNIIQNEFILALCEKGHKIFYDLSYLGLTKPYVFDVNHENILAVFVSFSKPFGLFYYRQGFLFSRVAIPALYGNKWFKNIFSLIVADKIMDRVKPTEIYDKYSLVQSKVVGKLNLDFGINFHKSDVIILSYLKRSEFSKLTHEQQEALRDFRRQNNYRFCLSPYFDEI